MNMDNLLSAENIATFKAPAADIPKKTLLIFIEHILTRSIVGFLMGTLRKINIKIVKAD